MKVINIKQSWIKKFPVNSLKSLLKLININQKYVRNVLQKYPQRSPMPRN